MKIHTELAIGEEQLILEAETEGESEAIIQFDDFGKSLIAVIHKDQWHKNTLIVIQKEA